MVNLATTSPILSALEAIPPSTREDLNLPVLESLALGKPISHDQIIRISRYFKETQSFYNPDGDGGTSVDRSLDALLRGTKLYIPPPPPKPEPACLPSLAYFNATNPMEYRLTSISSLPNTWHSKHAFSPPPKQMLTPGCSHHRPH